MVFVIIRFVEPVLLLLNIVDNQIVLANIIFVKVQCHY